MNDLLSNLDVPPPAPAPRRPSRTHRAVLVAPSASRLVRDWGGAIKRLATEGFEVHVLAGDDGGLARLEEVGALPHALPALEEAPANLALWLGAFFIIQGHLIEAHATMVHALGSGPLAWATALAASRAGADAIFVTVEDHRWLTTQRCASPRAALTERLAAALMESARARAGGVPAQLWRWLGERVDAYLTVTREDMELVTHRRLISPEKVEVLIGGQGYDRDHFDAEAAPSREEARAQLGVPAAWREVVGVAGQLDGGARELPQVIDALARERAGVGWLIARPADMPASLARALEARSEHVLVVEPGLDMRRFYAALDLFASLRYREGIATSVLEAQAMRLPCVAYATRGASASISHEQTGRLVEPGDPAGFARAIAALLGDPRRLRDYGAAGRPFVSQRFARADAHDQLLRIYDRVLERKLGA